MAYFHLLAERTNATVMADETWKVIAFIRSIYKGDPSRIVW